MSGAGHNGDAWESNSRAKIRSLLDSPRFPGTISALPRFNASLLPLLASIMSEKLGHVRILDFGGGPGVTYVHVAGGISNPEKLDYHIVDTEVICRIGDEVFPGDERVHFHTALPDLAERVDIVHLGSSLQYIDDWKNLLKRLATYQPHYFMLTDVPAGTMASYVTAQNYYGSRIPARIFNFQEIVAEMAANAFSLLFHSKFEGTYFGKVQPMPMDNFPKDLRVGDTCSLLFCRDAAVGVIA